MAIGFGSSLDEYIEDDGPLGISGSMKEDIQWAFDHPEETAQRLELLKNKEAQKPKH